MEKDLDQVELEFSQTASRVLTSLYNNFEDAVHRLDRGRDENVFQQLLGKYIYSLRMQLDHVAKCQLDKYRAMRNITVLEKKLTNWVDMYLNEFRQKAESM